MDKATAVVMSILLLCFMSTRSRAQDAAPYNANISHFESHGETTLEAILRLGKRKVPLGIVQMDDRLCKSGVDVTVNGETFLNTANRLLNGINGYQAVVRDGTIVVEPQVMPPNSGQLLNLVIERYTAPPSKMQALGIYLWRYVYAVFHPTLGATIDILGSSDDIQIRPLEMRNATVEQILNRIVGLGGGGVWVVSPVPDDYHDKLDLKVADVWSYADDARQIRKISCTP